MMDDYISKTEAFDIVRFECGEWLGLAKTIEKRFDELPSEDVIPVAWIEEQIKWLKEMDNEFASLVAGNISMLLNTWRDEVKDG